jgi:hypothetical protein
MVGVAVVRNPSLEGELNTNDPFAGRPCLFESCEFMLFDFKRPTEVLFSQLGFCSVDVFFCFIFS